jgi:excisionase family DNA binding protein
MTMKTDEKIPELLTMKETCELLKVHPNTLRQWDKKGILKAVRFGARKDRRYKKDEVLDLLNGSNEI